jgi:hypothetical protein
MAFPGTYNFNYYRGDTFEFRIYPKDSSGAAFDLSGYNASSGSKFTISKARGAAGAGATNRVICDSVIDASGGFVECTIAPEDGIGLDPDITYVYDVEISKVVGTSPNQKTYTYTLLTGSVTVTDHVSGATTED